MTKVQLTRKHYSGSLKITDRKPKLDGEGKATGEFEAVEHYLKPDMCKVIQEKDEAGKMRTKALEGVPFEVHDVDFVMKNHGSILKKV